MGSDTRGNLSIAHYVYIFHCNTARTGYYALRFQGQHHPSLAIIFINAIWCMSLQIKWLITPVITFDHEELGVSVQLLMLACQLTSD